MLVYTHVEVRGQLMGMGSLLIHVEPRNQNQVFRLESKHFNPQRYLLSLIYCTLNFDLFVRLVMYIIYNNSLLI